MFHRTPEKYNYTSQNIIVGKAELPYDSKMKAWIAPGGKMITHQADAIRLAGRMDEVMETNALRIQQGKQKF